MWLQLLGFVLQVTNNYVYSFIYCSWVCWTHMPVINRSANTFSHLQAILINNLLGAFIGTRDPRESSWELLRCFACFKDSDMNVSNIKTSKAADLEVCGQPPNTCHLLHNLWCVRFGSLQMCVCNHDVWVTLSSYPIPEVLVCILCNVKISFWDIKSKKKYYCIMSIEIVQWK